MSGPSAKIIAPRVAAIRALAVEAGRNPAEILMFSMMTIILDRTEAEAAAKYADYRRHIGLVLQEPFLFFGTIGDNVAYGVPGAGPARVISAARAAGLRGLRARTSRSRVRVVGDSTHG